MTIHAELEAIRERVEGATEGPWEWSKEQDGWGDCGPNLETVKRGPVYQDGSQGAHEQVIGSWGHDANGIFVDTADAEFIAHARTDLPRLLDAVEKVLAIVEDDAWTEQGTDFGHVTAVNADDIRDAITTALTT